MTATSASATGSLYIVATPIGNRQDISFRALSTLQTVDKILAEDTRHSSLLLSALGVHKPLVAYHAHNEAQKTPQIIDALSQGQSFALISDAGTPLISDPGYTLVSQARAKHIPVIPIPGPCAVVTALSAAGIPCQIFTFVGFLPAKQAARVEKLRGLQAISHTLVFYESPHRLMATLDDMAHVFGQQVELILAKELTKTFEQIIPGSFQQIQSWLLADPQRMKGEFVLILSPRPERENDDIEIQQHQHLLRKLLAELSVKKAVSLAVDITGQSKNVLYKMALDIEQDRNSANE